MPFIYRVLCLAVVLGAWGSVAAAVEVFAKGSVSKNYISQDKFTISVSATTGVGFELFGGVRIEGRYTNISALQNRLDVVTDTVTVSLTDIKTQTAIYSIGLDIDFLGEKSVFQPFIFIGAGYIQTDRSYYFQVSGVDAVQYAKEPKQAGVSGNLGLGFRLRIARALAFEVEAFGYGIDVDKPNPLVNLYGTCGIRIFL